MPGVEKRTSHRPKTGSDFGSSAQGYRGRASRSDQARTSSRASNRSWGSTGRDCSGLRDRQRRGDVRCVPPRAAGKPLTTTAEVSTEADGELAARGWSRSWCSLQSAIEQADCSRDESERDHDRIRHARIMRKTREKPLIDPVRYIRLWTQLSTRREHPRPLVRSADFALDACTRSLRQNTECRR